MLREFIHRLFGWVIIDVTRYVQYSKPIDKAARKRLNDLIKKNKGRNFPIGTRVRYVIKPSDIIGGTDPQRPDFQNAVVISKKKGRLVRIEQNRKSIEVLPELLETIGNDKNA